MSLTGSGPDDPQRVGVPIADLLAGMYGAYGVARRAARAGPHRRRHRRADLAARRGRRRARLPGHPVDRRRRGRPGAGQPPPLDRALRAVPLPRRRGADRRRQRGAVAAVLRRLRRSTPRRRGPGDQRRAGRPTGTASIAVVEAAFADWDAEPLLARLAEVGVPAGKVRTLDEVYAWDQTAQPGPARRRRAPDARPGARCPGRRCGSSTPTAPRSPAREHAAPPTLDQHGARRVRALARGGRRVTQARWAAQELLDLVLDAGLLRVLGRAGRHQRATARPTAPSCEAAAAEGRHRRVGAHRPRPGPRPAGRRRRQRVPLPRRLDRPGRGATGSSPPYAGPPPRACRCWPPPPPAAPGCRRAPRPSCRWSRSPGP